MTKLKTARGGPLLEMAVTVSICGVLLSLCVHVYALLGLAQPFGQFTLLLHFGAILAAAPVIYTGGLHLPHRRKLHGGKPYRAAFKSVLRHGPVWLKWLTAVLFVYAAVYGYRAITAGVDFTRRTSAEYRLLSSHWMFLYCVILLFSYSFLQERKRRSCECDSPQAALNE